MNRSSTLRFLPLAALLALAPALLAAQPKLGLRPPTFLPVSYIYEVAVPESSRLADNPGDVYLPECFCAVVRRDAAYRLALLMLGGRLEKSSVGGGGAYGWLSLAAAFGYPEAIRRLEAEETD